MEDSAISVYLPARCSRRLELCAYAETLGSLGFRVTSRWLDGSHQVDDRGLSVEAPAAERERFASEDWEDVMRADWCVSFTEPPRSSNSRGGRHVEFGAALAAGKRCIVIGPRENVFHCLPRVEVYPAWEDFHSRLASGGFAGVAGGGRTPAPGGRTTPVDDDVRAGWMSATAIRRGPEEGPEFGTFGGDSAVEVIDRAEAWGAHLIAFHTEIPYTIGKLGNKWIRIS